MNDARTFGHLDPIASALMMDGIATLGLLGLIGFAIALRFRFAAAAKRADNATKTEASLVPGDAALFGQVELAQNDTVAVRVEVEQEAREFLNAAGDAHEWVETGRRTIANPFYLKLRSGERVRIEPPSDVHVVDQLSGVSKADRTHRVRYTDLSPGEWVHVVGTLVKGPDPEARLGDGYRARQEGLVMRASTNGGMFLSTEPLGKRWDERATFYEGCVVALFLIGFAFHFYFMEWHVRRYWGKAIDVEVRHTEQVVSTDPQNGDRHTRYRLIYEGTDEREHTIEVSEDTAALLKPKNRIPVLFVDGFFVSKSTLGKRNTIDTSAVAIVPLLLVTLGLFRLRERKNRPWYEKKLIDAGQGKLPPGDGLFLA